MKLFFCLLASILASVSLHSQNCKSLDSKLFFKSIKFGDQVPDKLTACSKSPKLEYSSYIDYRLEYDSLNKDCRKRHSDIFEFLSIPFSFSEISTNKKGQIFQVELYSFFDDTHRKDSIISVPPANFVKIFNKLVALYGKPTEIKEATNSDSLFIKELGIPRLIVWECNNISLRLRVNYGSREKALNLIDVQIRNTQFELIEELKIL